VRSIVLAAIQVSQVPGCEKESVRYPATITLFQPRQAGSLLDSGEAADTVSFRQTPQLPSTGDYPKLLARLTTEPAVATLSNLCRHQTSQRAALPRRQTEHRDSAFNIQPSHDCVTA
jgi:hypothetical protein